MGLSVFELYRALRRRTAAKELSARDQFNELVDDAADSLEAGKQPDLDKIELLLTKHGISLEQFKSRLDVVVALREVSKQREKHQVVVDAFPAIEARRKKMVDDFLVMKLALIKDGEVYLEDTHRHMAATIALQRIDAEVIELESKLATA